jgi:NAD(P)-dependent dehydrogenase (short-subunit alcohol dehydrogenase family)
MPRSDDEYSGLTALVTGGSSGIGAEIAVVLGRHGAVRVGTGT